MRPTSEEILNLSRQPDNFCFYIDKIIPIYEKMIKEVESIKDDSEALTDTGDLVDTISELSYHDVDLEILDSLQKEMSKWANDWLNIYKNNYLHNEKCKKVTEAISIVERTEIFINSFNEDHNKSMSGIEKNDGYFNSDFEDFNFKIRLYNKRLESNGHEYAEETEEELISDSNSCISELSSYDSKIKEELENIRTSASDLRQYINETLKPKTKSGMIEIENETYLTFLNDYNIKGQ